MQLKFVSLKIECKKMVVGVKKIFCLNFLERGNDFLTIIFLFLVGHARIEYPVHKVHDNNQ